ncbi:hypothetical protein ACFXK0_13920 [Nocardia sp. NPDC059177]|uniref:hypothetical protein n=1 Tax=Nocardia sp. NPDC059177 TaxID=3346759 RepID=UPI0036BA6C8B
MIVPPNKPEPLPMPEDVGTARQLWWGVAGLGVVYTIASVISMYGQRGDLSKQFLDDMRKTDPNITAATVDALILAGFGVTALIGLVLCGVTALIAHQLGRGKSWARVLLTVAAVWLALGAVTTMFNISMVAGAAALVSGATAIVQGVLAAGAAYLSFRPDSSRYFQLNKR